MRASIAAAKLLRQRGAGEPIEITILLGTGLGALRVAALSIVTNFGAGFSGGNPSHEETKRAALAGAMDLKRLIRNFLKTKNYA